MTLDPRSSTLKIGDILFIYSHTAMLIREDSYVHHWGSALSEQLCFSLLSNTFGTEATIMCLPFSYPQITSLLLLPPSLPPPQCNNKQHFNFLSSNPEREEWDYNTQRPIEPLNTLISTLKVHVCESLRMPK